MGEYTEEGDENESFKEILILSSVPYERLIELDRKLKAKCEVVPHADFEESCELDDQFIETYKKAGIYFPSAAIIRKKLNSTEYFNLWVSLIKRIDPSFECVILPVSNDIAIRIGGSATI